MPNTQILKIVSYLALFLIGFFLLINNINILSSLESRNGRLSSELSRQEDVLARTIREQEVDLSDEIREKESEGGLEFVSQSNLISITEFLPESGGQDEATPSIR